ncbi:hypothetical protein [Catenulispora subtropica]|uniref:Uncharacterized protein n=1 Tax=Catenulispora subtropica TaxID=450798 RepID=A0ABP5BV02_9ACTN
MGEDGSGGDHALRKTRPEARDVTAVRGAIGAIGVDARSHFARRALLIRGLMSGALDAADAVSSTRPAVELLGLLVPIDGLTERYLGGRDPAGLGVTASDFEGCRRELVAVVAAMFDRWWGEDPELWSRAVARAGAWRGTVTELVASAAGLEDRGRLPDGGKPRGRAPRWPRGVDASAVLLSMAPPGVVELFLDGCQGSEPSRGILTRMLDRGPVLPSFVDYALGGLATRAMVDAYLRNPVIDGAALRERVLRDPANVEVLQDVYLNRSADRALRVGCVRRAEAAGGFQPAFAARLVREEHDSGLMEPLLASGDPQLVHRLLKRLNGRLSTPALRWAGYATLARAAGPEPVWALEQERVGRLEKMAEPVRASMATGDVTPILAFAEAVPLTIGAAGTAMELGAPVIEPWPYTELIRRHVEGSPDRVRAVGTLRGWWGTEAELGAERGAELAAAQEAKRERV